MANEKEDLFLKDECVDDLSDVPIEFDDSDEKDFTRSEDEFSDAEFSNTFETHLQRNQQFLSSSNNIEELNEDVDIKWSDLDPPRNNNKFEGFLGPNLLPRDTQSVEDFADLFIGDDLFEFIATETNKYHAQNFDRNKQYKKSAKWIDASAGELKKWFALSILMGLIKKSRMDDYWSTNPLMETPIFHRTMSRNRFRQILTFIHFSDNTNMPNNADRLFKVQYIIDYFSKKFREMFNPGQNISIVESIIPWRGQLSFKVYNPSKIIKYGILIRTLCDSTTGYISCFKIYSGAKQTLNSTIMELLTHSVGRWHHLYIDDYYNSVELAANLLQNKIRVCGAIRQNQGFPTTLKSAQLNVYETVFKRKGEILAQLWKPSKNKSIRIISTIHNAGMINTTKICKNTNRRIQKPKCIVDYNQYIKGVDRADQYLNYYPIYRKTIKWSKKVALYLFNCGLFNAFRVYKHFNVNSPRNLHFHDFLLKLCEAWLKDNLTDTEENFETPTTSRAPHHDSTHRLSGQLKQHQLILISQTDKRKRRRCRVCSANKIRKTTNLMCKFCKVPLHLGDCFASYHLKKKY